MKTRDRKTDSGRFKVPGPWVPDMPEPAAQVKKVGSSATIGGADAIVTYSTAGPTETITITKTVPAAAPDEMTDEQAELISELLETQRGKCVRFGNRKGMIEARAALTAFRGMRERDTERQDKAARVEAPKLHHRVRHCPNDYLRRDGDGRLLFFDSDARARVVYVLEVLAEVRTDNPDEVEKVSREWGCEP